MLAFILSLFPPTAIFGTGHFILDGYASWAGWLTLSTLIAQVAVLAMLRQSIVRNSKLINVEDVMCEPETQYLTVTALVLLFLGFGQYLYGIWRTSSTQPAPKRK